MSLFSQTGCNELFFSEYGEGSGYNKYVEIYNPTANAISLSTYKIYLNLNGSTWQNNIFDSVAVSIPSGDVYVITNIYADSTILAEADTALAYGGANIAFFNGNDALILVNGTDTIDIIGVPGVNPGQSWTVGTGSTKDYTLVRKSSVTGGSTSWTTGATEWDVYSQNTWTYIGSHPNIAVTLSGPLDFCSGGSVTLTADLGQTYLWSNGDTTQSITTTQAGTYSAFVTPLSGCAAGYTASYSTTLVPDPDTSVTISGSLNLCSGETVTLTAAAGQNYLWNTGATTQSITTTSIVGSYSYSAIVTTSNGCIDTTASYVVTINPLPSPTILASQLVQCAGQTITLSTQTTYSSYLWGGDSLGLGTQDTLVVTPGTYWLSVTDSSGCIGTDTITITEYTPYTTQPEVCILTNDPITGFNQVIWERSSKKGVEYYNVYRDDFIGYTKIGSKGVNQLSQLTDSTAMPGLQPYKYYITITDSCGIEHGSSNAEHSTIHLQSSIGTSGEVNLLWTSYLGRTPLYYRISRKGVNDSVYNAIDSVNLTNNSYTDFNTLTGFTKYQISAVMSSGCNSSSKTGVISSLSNESIQNTVSINEDDIGSIAISPNPNTGYFSIIVDENQIGSVYRILDNLGRLIDIGIITEQIQSFDLSDKPKGMYRIQVSNEYMAKTLSVVIQ